MTELPFSATTPTHISKVGLKARDAEALSAFYTQLLGLSELARRDGAILLGVNGRELMEIENAPSAKPDDPRSAGLFHTAFLLPTRKDLARWVRHAGESGIAVTGASDHLVSEALYLNDPEGNGIEIYADRPKETWTRNGGDIAMATERLNIDGLLGEIDASTPVWHGAPEATVIGHVHLRVGDPKVAEDWWHSELGLETMARYGSQALFLASGGYHHHIGANSWASADAGPRDPDRSGLSYVELASRDHATRTLRDPWGTEIRVRGA
ncbi:VOC family protein [Mesorhizobium sp. YIM 152430]|uniref:VOC family protein n=1 Tax=Mesorhizobium sp. YIM 152430 TaxID=3031761 RepID=UPI0023DC2753|nr:VOC family protein [Mesorhizobium sp. YIM 152430]MDF1599812.1 VOC family protein [Mesorhizobium sp. YIM 152430]